MKFTVVPAGWLTPEQVLTWSQLQRNDPAVDSPYFRPEFTQAVAQVRGDVEVAILEEDGATVGFFPFQRGRWGLGRPVGGNMSDFQGIVARPGLLYDPIDLVRGCGLSGWDFDHLVAGQRPFVPHCYLTAESPYMDLSAGYEAYLAERNRAGTDAIRQIQRKARKVEREIGPLRFEFHTNDPQVFATLLEWKSAQYRRTRAPNIFAYGWTVKLLERILSTSGEAFAGVLSALYIGDRLVAVHLGMRSYGVLHSWFPAYDVSLAKFSPGLLLLLEIARAGAALGIRRLDLGRGEKEYKSRLQSGAIPLVEGCVAVRPVVRLLRRGWHDTRQWVRSSSLGAPVRLAARMARPLRTWLAFR
jgi:CelD/BcsL family acetyltransferase involved in cellulose biosynthesis